MAFREIGWQKGEITPSWGTFNVTQADEGKFEVFCKQVAKWIAQLICGLRRSAVITKWVCKTAALPHHQY